MQKQAKNTLTEKQRTIEHRLMTVELRVKFIEEALKDLRDDIDYLFRTIGKIEENIEIEDY